MKKYLAFLKIGFQVSFAYRATVFLRAIRHSVVALTFILFWSAVLKVTENFSGFTISSLVTYYVLIEIIDTFYTQTPGRILTRDINSGDLNSYLLKPISYWGYLLCYVIGQQIGGCSLSLLLAILAFIFFPQYLTVPINYMNNAYFLIALITSFLLYFQIFFIVGSLTFFLSQTNFLRQGINQIAGVLGGKWIPIALMPIAVSSFIQYLPFRFLYDAPLKIFQEKISLYDAQVGLLIGLCWLTLLFYLGKFVWDKGIHNYEAYGH